MYAAESYHEFYKQKLLGADEVSLPNKKTTLITRSTADLDTAEFAEYVEKVEADLAERDVYLDEMPA